jgi:hypothetical protein
MLVVDFLNILLDDTAEDVRQRFRLPADRLALEGARRGIEDCRTALGGNGMERRLARLVAEARVASAAAGGAPDEWFWVARDMYVEWIARVVSVMLVSQRRDAIVPPSRAAALEAARVIGVVGA